MSSQPREEEAQAFVSLEEPLGFSAEEGLGYYRGGPGRKLGPHGRYEIKQKLGWGTASTVWLAKYQITDRFVTLKILSGYCSEMNRQHRLQELDIVIALGSEAKDRHCSFLLDYFIEAGVENEDGNHLCLVLELYRCNVQDVEKNLPAHAALPLSVIKRILKDVLLATAFLHRHGVAHTDIKPDNVMLSLDSTFNVEQWLQENPPKTYDPFLSPKGNVRSYVSHQLPLPNIEELSTQSFILSDLSNAQFVNRQTTDNITPLGLRPPEVLLGGEWNQSVDIWTLGNLVFYLLTRQALFRTNPTSVQLELFWDKGLRPPEMQKAFEAKEPLPDSVDFLLYQMVIFSVEHFSGAMLRACRDSAKYFENSCKLRMFNKFVPRPFFECLGVALVPLSPKERESAAAFMKRCLQLDPSKRASAAELLVDPWLLS